MNQHPFAKLLGYLIALVIYPIILVTGPFVIADELYGCWRMSSIAHGQISESTIGMNDKDEPLYEVRLQYSYPVHGKTYHNSHYGASWHTPGKEYGPLISALWTKISYPRGSPVTIYFDPDDPQRSCLHRGISTWAIGLTLLSTGVLLLFLQQKLFRFSLLVKQDYATFAVFGGLILLLIGPRTMTLTWFIIISALFFIFLTNPGWHLFCRILGRKPAMPLLSNGEPASPLDKQLNEQEKAMLFQESYPKP